MKLLTKARFVEFGAMILAAACLGFGSWGMHKSSERGTNITLASTTKLQNGDTLRAGTYRMEVAQNTQTPQVTFYKDGKVEATVNAKAINEAKKNSGTKIETVAQGNEQKLTSIYPNGWREKLVFQSHGA